LITVTARFRKHLGLQSAI